MSANEDRCGAKAPHQPHWINALRWCDGKRKYKPKKDKG